MKDEEYTFKAVLAELDSLHVDKKLVEKLEFLGYKINYVVNKSILEGEYVCDLELETIFSKLNQQIERLKIVVGIIDADIPIDNDVALSFIDFFHYQLNLYELFTGKMKRLYDKSTLKYIDKNIFLDKRTSIYMKYEQYLFLFDNNIELSKIDHQFSSDESIIKELFKLKNDIGNSRLSISAETTSHSVQYDQLQSLYGDLVKALRAKVQFLIDKWNIRSGIKSKEQQFSDIHLFSPSISNWLDPSNTQLHAFKEKIIYLYEIEKTSINHKKLLKECFNRIDRTHIDQLTFFDLHTLIKYYKDLVKNKEKLKELIAVFDKKVLPNNDYENFAYQIARQYCLNNYFSIYCEDFLEACRTISPEQLGVKLNDFYIEYRRIKDESTELTDNFFLESKFLDYSIRIIEKCLKNEEQHLEYIKASMPFVNEILHVVFKEYELRAHWSMKNNNYIFKLPYAESLLRSNGLNVYFSSSFLLPIVHEDIVNQKKQLELPFQRLGLIYSTVNQISEIKGLKEDFKSDNKRTIEIVTIFTAVISFIMGSIGGFKFVDNIYNAIAFTLSFGLCLSFFITLVLRLIRKEEEGFLWRNFGVVVIIVVLIISALVLSKETYITKDNLKEELLKLRVGVKD